MAAFFTQNLGGGGCCKDLHLWMVLSYSANAGWIVRTFRGSGNSRTLPAVIKFIWTFCTQQWQDTKTSSLLLLAPVHAPTSHLVKLLHHLKYFQVVSLKFVHIFLKHEEMKWAKCTFAYQYIFTLHFISHFCAAAAAIFKSKTIDTVS